MKRLFRRGAVFVVGVALLVAGLVLALPLVPGPGLVVMLLGLGLLATEFDWAKRLLARVRERAETAGNLLARGFKGRGDPAGPDPVGSDEDDERPHRVA